VDWLDQVNGRRAAEAEGKSCCVNVAGEFYGGRGYTNEWRRGEYRCRGIIQRLRCFNVATGAAELMDRRSVIGEVVAIGMQVRRRETERDKHER
jgi:hypothetical protein